MTTLEVTRPATATTRKPPARRSAPMEQLRKHLATSPFDSMQEDAHPEITEAMTLLKYASDDPKRCMVALGLLVRVTVEIAEDIHHFDPNLVKAVNLLHEHIHATTGFIPDAGQWKELSK